MTQVRAFMPVYQAEPNFFSWILTSMFCMRVPLGKTRFHLAKYAYLGAYLGAPNMVKWGVPEKILQNAVQTRWS